MDQEIPNEHQSSPAQIVAFVTGATQSLHSEPEFTPGNTSNEAAGAQELHGESGDVASIVEDLQETQELHEAETARSNPNPPIQPHEDVVDLNPTPHVPPTAVEIPRLVPRQSTFVPLPNTWWLFVDRDPQYAVRVNYQENDQLVNVTQITFTEMGELVSVEVGSEPLLEFRAGFYVEADSGDSLRFDAILKSGISKKREKTSDSERVSTEAPTSVLALFSSIGAELGVDQAHVQRLTESTLEGVRTFIALKSFVDSSPVVSALFDVLKTPSFLEAAKMIVSVPVQSVAQDTFHLLLNDTLEPVVESLQKLVNERFEPLQKELIARRQWESGFDEFARETKARIAELTKRLDGIVTHVDSLTCDVRTVEAAPSIDGKKYAPSDSAIDSRINPQTNEIREQIANLFERCDRIESARLKDQQARNRAEKARKQASAAKEADRKEAINAASRTLQERKRREAKEADSLTRAAARRNGPRLPSMQKKRGPGRPPTRKAIAEENLFGGGPVKRGRGRPRKNP